MNTKEFIENYEPSGILKRTIAELVQADLTEYGIHIPDDVMEKFASDHAAYYVHEVCDAIAEQLPTNLITQKMESES